MKASRISEKRWIKNFGRDKEKDFYLKIYFWLLLFAVNFDFFLCTNLCTGGRVCTKCFAVTP
jgi:hypothetical protein